MQFVNNGPEQIKLRKAQNTLMIVGTGTILFSIWTTVKSLGLLVILRQETIDAFRAFDEETADLSDRWLYAGVMIIVTIVFVVVLLIRIYIGRSAISEGRGKRPGPLYLVFGLFLIISSISYIYTSISTVFIEHSTPEDFGALTRNDSIPAIIIELTSLVMMIEMEAAAFRVRRMTRRRRHAKD